MRQTMLALLLLWTLVSCTSENQVVQTPPARYDHAFQGKVTIIPLDTVGIHNRCGPTAVSCALIGPVPECVIWINKVFQRYASWRKAILRHEQAHCNGWPANHPQ